MKILLIGHEFSRTGAPVSLLCILKNLKELGHYVAVWSLKDGPLQAEYEAIADSVNVIPHNELYFNAIGLPYAKKYDFILCNTIVTYEAVQVLQKCGRPLVWIIHETVFCEQYFQNIPQAETVLRSFSHIYTVSEYTRDYLTSRYNPNVQILMNCCEDTYVERRKKPADGSVHFGILGTVHNVKGNDLLVDAFLSLPPTLRGRAVLHIAGKMPPGLESFWKPLLQKTADMKNVRWHGEINGDAKREFFETIDLIVVPSRDEPASLALLEGCMNALPAIVSYNVGYKFLIDEKNGWIVETGSVDSLRDALSSAIKNKDRLKRMGTVSRERYLATSTMEKGKTDIEKMLAESRNQTPYCPVDRSFFSDVTETARNALYKFCYKYIFRKENRSGKKLVVIFGLISIYRKKRNHF